jgi:hypothetical protein
VLGCKLCLWIFVTSTRTYAWCCFTRTLKVNNLLVTKPCLCYKCGQMCVCVCVCLRECQNDVLSWIYWFAMTHKKSML